MNLAAPGEIGLGDWILEVDNGRPLGMSRDRLRLSRRDSRRVVEDEACLSRDECLSRLEECLDDDECLSEECLELLDLDELELDVPAGTSRMFNLRPVVGSTV